MRLFGIDIFQFLHGNYVRSIGTGSIKIVKGALLKGTRIIAYPGAAIEIGGNCDLENVHICVEKGILKMQDYVLVSGTNPNPCEITVNDGHVLLEHHSKLSCDRIWVRFGGRLKVGAYTNINRGSEIRCDEKVEIGAYNQISYDVDIWDTNTHNILSEEERRKITEEKFPYFGYENEKPITAPITIGDDCWIGKKSAILKGSSIGDGVIIGYDTVIAGKNIPSGSKVIGEKSIRII